MSRIKGLLVGLVNKLRMPTGSTAPFSSNAPTQEQSAELIKEIAYPPRADGIQIYPSNVISSAHGDMLKLSMFELGLVNPNQYGFNVSTLTEKTRVFNYHSLVESVVHRFIGYVHLLPASENHHHADVGGLIRHSLEVALYSLRHITKLELPPVRFPDELISKRSRWEYAAWITGLAHDLGKPLFDMIVMCEKGRTWNPNIQNIYEWQSENLIGKYQVQWRHVARHGRHTGLAAIILERILTPEAKKFLFDGTDDLQIMIQEALSGIDSGYNPILQALKKGEARSVHNDMKWQWDRLTGGRKLTLEAAFVKKLMIVRREWKINKLNVGKIWVIGQDVFVTYPMAISSIMDELRNDGWSVPPQATVMTEMLLERNLVEPICDDYITGYFTPDDQEGRPDRVIKLKWAGMLFEDEILPKGASGKIEVTKEGDKGVIYHKNATVEKFDITKEAPTAQPEAEEPADIPAEVKIEHKPKIVDKAEAKAQKKTAKNKPPKKSNDQVKVEEKPITDGFKGIVFANADISKKEAKISINQSPVQNSDRNNNKPDARVCGKESEVINKQLTNEKTTDASNKSVDVNQRIRESSVNEVEPQEQSTLPTRDNLLLEQSAYKARELSLIEQFIVSVRDKKLVLFEDYSLDSSILNLPVDTAKALVADLADEINTLKNDGLLELNPATPRKVTEKMNINGESKWCYRLKLTPELINEINPSLQPRVPKSPKDEETKKDSKREKEDGNGTVKDSLAIEDESVVIDKEPAVINEAHAFLKWLKAQEEPIKMVNNNGEALYNFKDSLSTYIKDVRPGAPSLEIKKAIGSRTKTFERAGGSTWLLIDFEGEK